MSEAVDSQGQRSVAPDTATPQVTIAVPTLGDREHWLRSCLTSIVDHGDLVRCVVVGPQTDQLKRLCDEHGATFESERVRGMANAVNQVLDYADTPYVSWLGDDDLLSSRSLNLTVEALNAHPKASMAYGQCRIIDGDGARLWTIRPGRVVVPLMRVSTQLLPQPGCLIRRQALDQVGLLDPELRNPMDLDLFLRLLEWGPFTYVPEVLSAFRVHPTSLTTTNPEPGAEAHDVRRRHLSRRAGDVMERADPVLRVAGKLVARLQMVDPRRDEAVFRG